MSAEKSSLARDAIILERTYRATPDRVFRAWEDVEARARWSKPWDEVDLIYDSHDFRVGGTDHSRCGLKGVMNWKTVVQYLDIVRDKRIIFSERMIEDDIPQSTSLITVEFIAQGRETRQVVTINIVLLDGSTMLEGYADGWGGVLDNIAKELELAGAR
jgi:uncharacterized protein YndB with AHSA1/START domain